MMEKQEKIIRQFFSDRERKKGDSPSELKPREGEKYILGWQMKTDDGHAYYELFQMGDVLYFTASTKTLADKDEHKILQLLNWLNGWSHYGIFTYAPKQKTVLYEQTHFCRFFEYTVEEINDFYRSMIKRLHVYHRSADDVFNNEVDIETAVDLANEVVKLISD
jgi:hypothetical protein